MSNESREKDYVGRIRTQPIASKKTNQGVLPEAIVDGVRVEGVLDDRFIVGHEQLGVFVSVEV